MKIKIDGQWYEVEKCLGATGYNLIETDTGEEFYLFESAEEAGKEARKYYEEMAQDDPEEFACIVGEETLIQWGLGNYAGPGTSQVSSLEEWLDLWLDTPEEMWASYDGEEKEVEVCGKLLSEELGFIPTVAYRHN